MAEIIFCFLTSSFTKEFVLTYYNSTRLLSVSVLDYSIKILLGIAITECSFSVFRELLYVKSLLICEFGEMQYPFYD